MTQQYGATAVVKLKAGQASDLRDSDECRAGH